MRLAIGLALTLAAVSGPWVAAHGDEAWRADWEVAKGFSLSVDTSGYHFATSIAFVPNPGPDPKDPLYFVTELRGRIRVVTNDRSVHTFAEDFFHLAPIPAPDVSLRVPEIGMAGIALDEEHGYVFVSFTYETSDRGVSNNIVRFQTVPGSFAIRPTAQVEFTEVFRDQVGDHSHMIGPMVVAGGNLFVNVGDAHAPALASSLDSTAGKILRMTLDGDPVPDNPFYRDAARTSPRNYVWASGFRNPFGAAAVDGQYFVNDVGPSVDRFLLVKPGWDYGYDGTDWSISSHADVVFTPTVSPVQLVYHPADRGPLVPHLRGRFFMVTSGDQLQMGPSSHGDKAVLMLDYDLERERVLGRPEEILRYRGDRGLMPVGLALGPDGLYMVTFSLERELETSVVRIDYDPENAHPFVFDEVSTLLLEYGCQGCHTGAPGAPGPSLEVPGVGQRLLANLESPDYERRSLELDRHQDPLIRSFAEQRRTVRDAKGYEKVELWIEYRLMNPRFDMPEAIMPDLPISEREARLISKHLAGQRHTENFVQRMRNKLAVYIPVLRQRHLLVAFLLGLGLGAAATQILLTWRSRHR